MQQYVNLYSTVQGRRPRCNWNWCDDDTKYRIENWPSNVCTCRVYPKNYAHKSRFLPEASFGLQVLSLLASVRPSVRPSVSPSVTKFVRAITHQPFKLRSPNLDQRCKRHWLRSLLFCGTIDRDLQGQIELQSQNVPHFELVPAITHHQLKLQFPNLEQKCILALFRSLPTLGLIEIDLQFNFWFQTQTKLSFLCTSLTFFSETS